MPFVRLLLYGESGAAINGSGKRASRPSRPGPQASRSTWAQAGRTRSWSLGPLSRHSGRRWSCPTSSARRAATGGGGGGLRTRDVASVPPHSFVAAERSERAREDRAGATRFTAAGPPSRGLPTVARAFVGTRRLEAPPGRNCSQIVPEFGSIGRLPTRPSSCSHC